MPRLRTAAPSDAEFLLALYASIRQAEVAFLPGTPEAKTAFIEMQFRAQERQFAAAYPEAQRWIVMKGEAAVGRLCVDRQAAQILIVDLALLPAYQRQGIGRALVSDLQRQARADGIAISGHVLRTSPAQCFWERMGFTLTPIDDMYLRILWNAAKQASQGS